MCLSWEFLYWTVLPTCGSCHKQSYARWRVLQKSVCFVWKDFLKMAVLLWYNVSTKRDLTKETFRTIGSQAISGKVQCFQVSEWTSVCSQFLFVVQTELEFSNFATNIFIVQRSVSSVKRNVTLKLKRHRKNTNNRSLKLSLSLSLTHTHTTQHKHKYFLLWYKPCF